MKCDKSFKRTMLVHWGMRQLNKGMSYADVCAGIRKHMRKTVAEVQELLKVTA